MRTEERWPIMADKCEVEGATIYVYHDTALLDLGGSCYPDDDCDDREVFLSAEGLGRLTEAVQWARKRLAERQEKAA